MSAVCEVDQVLSTLALDQSSKLDTFVLRASTKALAKTFKASNVNVVRVVDGQSVVFYQNVDKTLASQLRSIEAKEAAKG